MVPGLFARAWVTCPSVTPTFPSMAQIQTDSESQGILLELWVAQPPPKASLYMRDTLLRTHTIFRRGRFLYAGRRNDGRYLYKCAICRSRERREFWSQSAWLQRNGCHQYVRAGHPAEGSAAGAVTALLNELLRSMRKSIDREPVDRVTRPGWPRGGGRVAGGCEREEFHAPEGARNESCNFQVNVCFTPWLPRRRAGVPLPLPLRPPTLSRRPPNQFRM
jgi:hypothetical protein